MTTNIVTHSRFFNLDEIAAIALLDIFELNGDYKLIRTRDEKILNEHKNNDKSFVIDVGFEYDSSKLNFDHHQNKMTLTWDGGIPYSSCGLIWKWLKDNNKLTQFSNNEIMKIESSFIRKVDALDNGIKKFPEMQFVAQSNRKHHDDNVIDNHFKRTLYFVKNHISSLIKNVVDNVPDVSKTSVQFNPFFDKLTVASLIKNYYSREKIKMTATEKTLSFVENDKEVLFLNFEEKTIIKDGVTTTVDKTFTEDIWNKIKSNKKVINQKMNNETIDLIEELIINPVLKGGTIPLNLSYIAMYEDSTHPEKDHFEAMNGFIHNVFADIRNTLKNNKEINKFINKSKDLKGIVLCDSNIKNAPNKISELCGDKVLIIVPRDKNSWKIQKLPHKNNEFLMPKKWRGLNKNEIKKVSGENRLIFCDKAGFMCMFEGTKEEVIDFSQTLLKSYKPEIKRNMRFR